MAQPVVYIEGLMRVAEAQAAGCIGGLLPLCICLPHLLEYTEIQEYKDLH